MDIASLVSRAHAVEVCGKSGKAGDKLVRVGFSNSYPGTSDDAAILRMTGKKGASSCLPTEVTSNDGAAIRRRLRPNLSLRIPLASAPAR